MYVWTGRSALALALGCATTLAAAADGDLDTTFGNNGFQLSGVTDTQSQLPSGFALQPDGKIVLCSGEGTAPADDFYVVRYTANGDLDTSFSFDGRLTIDFGGGDDYCSGVAVQADGKIVVAGWTYTTPTTSDFAIARINPDGTLDTAGFGAGTGKVVVSFDLGGTNSDVATDVAIKSDGKIVVGGYADTASNGLDFAVLQLNADGSRDTSFNLTGRATIGFDLPGSSDNNDMATQVAIDAAGRIVIAGSANGPVASGTDFAVARLLANGTPDSNFSADGKATVAFNLGGATGSNDDAVYSLVLQRDGRIVLSGITDSSATSGTQNLDMAIARLLPDGSLDAGFGLGGRTTIAFDLGPNGEDIILGAAEQSNGRLVFAGAAVDASSAIFAAAVRLTSSGLPDNSFGTLGKKTYDFGQTPLTGQLFNGVGFQSDNRIVYGGALNVIDNSHVDVYVARAENDLIFANGFQ